jgi:hypothetical protein
MRKNMTIEAYLMILKQVLSNILGFPHRRARRAAKEAFGRMYPDETIGWTTFRADEDTRYIVGVFYGATRPPYYIFFEVRKNSDFARQLEDDEPYRPRVWR